MSKSGASSYQSGVDNKISASNPGTDTDSEGEKYPFIYSRLGLANVLRTTLGTDEVCHLALSVRSPDVEKGIGVLHAPAGPWLRADSSALTGVAAAADQKMSVQAEIA